MVFYDDGFGVFVVCVWWLLYWLGKCDGVYFFDGGLVVWKVVGLVLINGESSF